MANLYQYQSVNIRRTWFLFIIFSAVVLGIGYFFSIAYNDPSLVVFSAIFTIAYSLISYFFSDKIALSMAHATRIEKKDNPQLYNLIENLAITAGLPMPRVYITPEFQINAFATGRNPKNAAVAVTAGAIERLSPSELEAVMAHELSHIGNRDILVSTIAAVLAGIVSLLADMFLRSVFWGGSRDGDRNNSSGILIIFGIALALLAPIGTMLIQFAISRRRESLADASGMLLTRYPDALISALKKIQLDQTPMDSAKSSTAHMWLDNPFKGRGANWLSKLFLTHPPIEDRIRALQSHQ